MSESSSRSWEQRLVASLPSGLLVLGEALRIRQANPALGEILGVASEALAGRELADAMPIEGLHEHALEVLRSGDAFEGFACRWQRGADEVRSLKLSLIPGDGAGGSLLVIVEDVTEKENLYARAQLSERGFREVIEHSPDGVAVHRDEKFLYLNASFLNLLGVEHADALVGAQIYDFVHADEREVLRDRVRRMLTSGERVPVRETRLLRVDGSQWVAALTARRVIFDGEPAIVSLASDITEKKKLAARTMQMDRMIAAGTLAAGVGHEINNPLTYVSANLDFALERVARIESLLALGEASAVARELSGMTQALSDAREGSGRIREIVGQLRTFTPGEKGTHQTLAIREIIESVLGPVSNEIRHRARFVLELGDEVLVHGDRGKLGQVFLNLLINAAHAIEAGSFEDNEISIRASVADDFAVVEVRDSGAGISPGNLQRVFDPFFTTKPVGQGTGLGLYICQGIVASHGGRIELDSRPGRGTVARVLLPLAAEQRKQEEPAQSAPAPAPVSTRGRILLVDDEPMIIRALSRTLRAGNEVVALSSAREALSLLETQPPFDVILCDLMMPDLSGMEFHHRVSELSPAMADSIVFITGGAFTPEAKAFLEGASNACVEKPIDVAYLRKLVSERVEAARSRTLKIRS